RACAKGRTKRESQENSTRHAAAGHERKIADRMQRAHHNASRIASERHPDPGLEPRLSVSLTRPS
ncbi:unnamed protein product, partial [Lampetra fluviatilis]